MRATRTQVLRPADCKRDGRETCRQKLQNCKFFAEPHLGLIWRLPGLPTRSNPIRDFERLKHRNPFGARKKPQGVETAVR